AHTTLLSSVPPKSGCGWHTTATARASSAAAAPAGVSMSVSSAPAGPASISRSASGGWRTTSGPRRRRGRGRRGEPHQQAVEALHVLGRVGERGPLGESGLVEEQLCELGELR